MAEIIINEVSVETKNALKGKISILDTLHGKSAYELAILNGFQGTEEEWLRSLKGEIGNHGIYLGSGDMPEDYNVQIDPNGDTLTIEDIIEAVNAQTNKITSVTLYADKWEGETSPYSQKVEISVATANSKINLNPTIEQLNIFYNKDISFVVENDEGNITVYCIGQKPTNNYTMQATLMEVVIDG